MAGIPNLTGLLGNIQSMASNVSLQDIIGNVAAGTIGTIALAGVKSQEGQDAIDFLHIFHKPATDTHPAVTAVVSGSNGNVMTMSQFLALSSDGQKTVEALKYTIIPG